MGGSLIGLTSASVRSFCHRRNVNFPGHTLGGQPRPSKLAPVGGSEGVGRGSVGGPEGVRRGDSQGSYLFRRDAARCEGVVSGASAGVHFDGRNLGRNNPPPYNTPHPRFVSVSLQGRTIKPAG
eukprot:3640085-Pyramimonas_sp.AAC.1